MSNPRWNQVSSQQNVNPSQALSEAGDLFNKALDSGNTFVNNLEQAKKTNLAAAQKTNQTNIENLLRTSGTQGLEEFVATKDSLGNLPEKYGKFLDMNSLDASVSNLRQKAFDVTAKNAVTDDYNETTKILDNNLKAANAAMAADPSLGNYVKISDAGNFSIQDTNNPEAIAAQNKFAQLALANNYVPQEAQAAKRERNRANLLNKSKMTFGETQQINATLDAAQQARNQLTGESKGRLDTAVASFAATKQQEMQSLDTVYAQVLKLPQNNLDYLKDVSNYSSAEDWIKKNNPEGTVRFGGAIKGGKDAIEAVKELRKNEGKGLSEPELIYLLSKNQETNNIFFDEGINFKNVRAELAEMKQLGLGGADMARFSAQVKEYENKAANINNKYTRSVLSATAALSDEAGIRNYRNNSDFIKGAVARATAIKGSDLTKAETDKVKQDAKSEIDAQKNETTVPEVPAVNPRTVNTGFGMGNTAADIPDLGSFNAPVTERPEIMNPIRAAQERLAMANAQIDPNFKRGPSAYTGGPQIEQQANARLARDAALKNFNTVTQNAIKDLSSDDKKEVIKAIQKLRKIAEDNKSSPQQKRYALDLIEQTEQAQEE